MLPSQETGTWITCTARNVSAAPFLGLEIILGRERLTMAFAGSGFSVRVPSGNAYQNPKHYITQFA